MVGTTSFSKLIDEILKLSPISTPSRSIIRFSGIFSLGHLSSTFLLTIFNTPPLFNPGDFSLFINFTGISRIIFATNWPVDSLYSSYKKVIDSYKELTKKLSKDEREAFFYKNAESIYEI